MAEKTFGDTLADIRGYSRSVLTVEERVKSGVILPLLSHFGWKTGNINEGIPEFETGRGPVDYALCIGTVPRVFVEAKSVEADLSTHEGQIQRYCEVVKPRVC